jgi:L-serine dehydratase
VQIHCIERNTMGSVKAINANPMPLKANDKHRASPENGIKTMRDTWRDMKDEYKETSRGGLAVNVIRVLKDASAMRPQYPKVADSTMIGRNG